MNEVCTTMNQAIQKSSLEAGKFLTFLINKETYGIGIIKVKEIISMTLEMKY